MNSWNYVRPHQSLSGKSISLVILICFLSAFSPTDYRTDLFYGISHSSDFLDFLFTGHFVCYKILRVHKKSVCYCAEKTPIRWSWVQTFLFFQQPSVNFPRPSATFSGDSAVTYWKRSHFRRGILFKKRRSLALGICTAPGEEEERESGLGVFNIWMLLRPFVRSLFFSARAVLQLGNVSLAAPRFICNRLAFSSISIYLLRAVYITHSLSRMQAERVPSCMYIYVSERVCLHIYWWWKITFQHTPAPGDNRCWKEINSKVSREQASAPSSSLRTMKIHQPGVASGNETRSWNKWEMKTRQYQRA